MRKRSARVLCHRSTDETVGVSSLSPRMFAYDNRYDTAEAGPYALSRARPRGTRGARAAVRSAVGRDGRGTKRRGSFAVNRVSRSGDVSTSRDISGRLRDARADKEIRDAGGEAPRRAPRGEDRIVRYPASGSEGHAVTKRRGPGTPPRAARPPPRTRRRSRIRSVGQPREAYKRGQAAPRHGHVPVVRGGADRPRAGSGPVSWSHSRGGDAADPAYGARDPAYEQSVSARRRRRRPRRATTRRPRLTGPAPPHLMVAVRTRPVLAEEHMRGVRKDILRVMDKRTVVVLDPDDGKRYLDRRGRPHVHRQNIVRLRFR